MRILNPASRKALKKKYQDFFAHYARTFTFVLFSAAKAPEERKIFQTT